MKSCWGSGNIMCLDLSASYKGVHFVKGYQFVIFGSVQFFVLMLHLSKKFALSKNWLLLLRQLAPRASEDLAGEVLAGRVGALPDLIPSG